MKFQTTSVRTWSFIHFILPWIRLQTRQFDTGLKLKDYAVPTMLDFCLFCHLSLSVITDHLICTQYLCVFNLNHIICSSVKDVGCQTVYNCISKAYQLAKHTSGHFHHTSPSLQSTTPFQTERSDEGGQNRTENSLLLLNYWGFFLRKNLVKVPLLCLFEYYLSCSVSCSCMWT